jgi:hypothetical protein
MKQLFLFIVGVLCLEKAFPAGWQSLNYGMDQYVQTIYIDSGNNKIYAGGYFQYADSINVKNIAIWDGTKWDSLGAGDQGSLYCMSITSYQGQIYADGRFGGSQFANFGGKFNQTNWDTLGFGVNGNLIQMKEINNELWVSGQFYKVDDDSCKMLAKYDGANWTCLNFPYEIGGRIEDFLIYNDTLVCGGLFSDSTNYHVGISYFNGSQFQILGHRLYGAIAGVHSMVIFRGELYIAGYFLASAGNEGNHIMRWDGSSWHDVGGGVDDEIYVLNVYNDELYAGGVFQNAGGVHTGNLAKWNGTTWSAVTSSIISPIIYDIQFYRDEIYIGGAFRYIDSINVNFIAKHALNTNVNELSNDVQLKVYPVPASEQLTVEITKSIIQRINVKDVSGKLIKSNSCYAAKIEIDIAAFASGIYFIEAISEQGTYRKKFVKN